MSNRELNIDIGIVNTRPDIKLGMLQQLKDLSIDLSGSGGYPVDTARIEIRTTEEWNNRMQYIPEAGRIIIYSDKSIIDGVAYPGIKIADGLAYVVDLPFVGDDVTSRIISLLEPHINDKNIHITDAERQFWNNKINYELDESGENLIINRQ